MGKNFEIKIEKQKKPEKKCEECPFFLKNAVLDHEIKKAIDLQREYLDKIMKVNKTLAKYDKKIEELDVQLKKKES